MSSATRRAPSQTLERTIGTGGPPSLCSQSTTALTLGDGLMPFFPGDHWPMLCDAGRVQAGGSHVAVRDEEILASLLL